MKSIVRKITRAKWSIGDWASVERIPADAISIDLRTSGNTLSVWGVTDTPDGLDCAILAILGMQDRIDTIDLLVVKGEDLPQVSVVQTDGKTSFSKFVNLHHDIIDLDGILIHSTAQVFGKYIYNDLVIRITRTQFIERLIKGIEKSWITMEELNEKVREEVQKKMSTQSK